MKKSICGIEYEIRPIPPSLTPYSARIIALLQRTPENIEQTREATKELQTLIKELLKETVKPEPAEEHELEIYNALVQVTNEILEKVKFFPGSRGSDTKKSSSARASLTRTPQ